MKTILLIIQIIVSVGLITTILLQKRSAGLGGAFGGSGATYHEKRGSEKILFYATIGLGILFIGVAFLLLLIR